MKISLHFIFFSFLCLLCPPLSQTALLAPIQKDRSTLLYSLTVYLKTPLQPTKLHLDLGSSLSWVDCSEYNSTTYKHIPCGSPLCESFHSLACGNCYGKPPGPGCANDMCLLSPENPITRQSTTAGAITDTLALPTTDGSTSSKLSLIAEFAFSCATTSLTEGLADKATGVAGLGRSNKSLPAQVSEAFSSPRYFALCLSSSPSQPGVAFFGTSGPYYFSPAVDLSKSLVYTPLILNPVASTVITYHGQPSDEYFINVTSITVNGKVVQFNNSQSLLTVNDNGFGGTKISTANPYTIMESSIYKAVVEMFVSESSGLNLTVTSAVQPFSVCYQAGDVVNTRVGPGVPTVDLVMHSEDVFWRIFGSNSMVRISDIGVDLWCLGFVDGGANPRTSIVVGGYQMEDNLLQFDMESKRFGFSSTLLLKSTNCANFDFSTNKNLDNKH